MMLAAMCAAGTTACYRYVPATPAELAPGAEIRAYLSPEGVERFRAPLGSDVHRVDGELLHWDDDGVAIAVSTDVQRGGFPATALVQTLELTPEQLSVIERREVDRLRTAGLVTAVAAAAAAALLATGTFGSEPDDNMEGGGAEPRVGVWLRFP